MTVDKAIDFISENYFNLKDWGRSYRKERAKWITKLQMWKKKFPELRKYWKKTNENMLETWTTIFDKIEEDQEKSESESKKAL